MDNQASLTIRHASLSELHPDPNNARTHSERNLAAIVGSLQKFGQVEPLVVQKYSGMIIGGNGRYEAMLALGLKTADIAEVQIGDKEAAALGLALNRTAELAGWDFQGLGDIVRDLISNGIDLGAIGWSEDDLSPILAADWTPAASSGDVGEDFEHGNKASAGDEERPSSGGPSDDINPGSRAGFAAPIGLTPDQRSIFEQAAARVRGICADESISEGRCMELICADYLASKAA
jgi:hypothetical protein